METLSKQARRAVRIVEDAEQVSLTYVAGLTSLTAVNEAINAGALTTHRTSVDSGYSATVFLRVKI